MKARKQMPHKPKPVQRLEERRAIRLNERTIELVVCKSSARRSNIKISVLPGQIVRLDVPAKTQDREINALLARRSAWIEKKLRESAARPQPERLLYQSGERHLYLGQSYPLRVIARKQGRRLGQALLENGEIRLSLNLPEDEPILPEHAASVRKIMRNWYADLTKSYISDFLDAQTKQIAWLRKAPRFSIRSMRRRWASCSVAGDLVVNRHLIKAPPECIHYVLLHEICHLRELNHGPKFYALLAELDPGWKQHRTLLDQLTRQIANE